MQDWVVSFVGGEATIESEWQTRATIGASTVPQQRSEAQGNNVSVSHKPTHRYVLKRYLITKKEGVGTQDLGQCCAHALQC